MEILYKNFQKNITEEKLNFPQQFLDFSWKSFKISTKFQFKTFCHRF